MGIIYSVHNKVNDKYYIGQTVKTLNRRIQSHLSDAFNRDSQLYFHRALRKHGRDNFEWKIIDEHEDPNILNQLEKLHVSRYESYKDGYNLTEGGGGISGWNHSPQTIQKMRKSFIGYKPSLESRKKISESQMGEKNNNYGKPRPLKTRRKISESLKGHEVSEEARQKISKSHIGKKQPPELIKKRADAIRGRVRSNETIKKIRNKAGRGLFGFAGGNYSMKNRDPWLKVWTSTIAYNNHQKSLGCFNDPLSCEIVYKLVRELL